MTQHPSLFHAYAQQWRAPGWAGQRALTDAQGTAHLTYAQLHAAVSAMAGQLRQAGVQPGQLLAIAMDRGLASVVAILGSMAAGACPCPLEPRLTGQEIRGRLEAAGIRSVLADASHLPAFADTQGIQLLQAQALPDAPPYWHADIAADDPGLLLFTSGSTGRPKGVLQSHRGLLNNARGVIPATGLTADDKLLHVMPLYHTNGLNNQLFSPLLAGAHIVLGDRFRAQDMPALMERHRPTIITGVPTMYSRMLDHAFTPDSLAALRFARCGSAPITRELHTRIEAFLGRPLIVSYGLSEATCTSTLNPPSQRKVGTIGKALPGQRVFLRDSRGQEITRPGVDGEICIAGDSLMLGYLGTLGNGVLEAAPPVLATGDLGRVDEDGYFTITGRQKDVIIRGGENISPTLIEQTLSSSPLVHSCCVVGKPDADLGEVPVAFVVAAAGTQATEADIKALVAGQLSRIHQLAGVVFMDTLPENAVGKVDRKALGAMV
ncbi:class I adenylate-forming enzyme family protein [Bordetella petrii]|uniref:class I adenylate-forming enzyme family protein n=1 Tax=Bordetella petrii TaxID=94624 RepID=UPI001E41C8D2|nr:class I adenylate-forming enzyme family protein [Bordetella petrii]MCD0504254.1 acyl--CoA ligase [Bordetella petrii]